jgi:histidinol-phosphatase (PHP family)
MTYFQQEPRYSKMSNTINITTDYHMHSTFSPDGDHSPAQLCQRALELGLTEIAITEHAEWQPASSLDDFRQAPAYFAALEQVRAEFGARGLAVYSGVELGNPHDYVSQASQLVRAYPFDVVIGSLHWLYGENIHLAACFAHRHPDQVYADYFVELGRMAWGFDFDIVAHFDRIIWRGTLLGAAFDPWRLEAVIRPALSAIAATDKALELNTRFLTHTPNWNEALVTMFGWFREAGGSRVVVNSDAHRISELGRNTAIAGELLTAAGFELPQQLWRVQARAAALA